MIESLFVVVIVFLIVKIKNLHQHKVKGVQRVTVIKKEKIVLNNEGKLKYFYEPKPNHRQVDRSEWFDYELEDMLSNNLNCKNIEHFEVINLGVLGYDVE